MIKQTVAALAAVLILNNPLLAETTVSDGTCLAPIAGNPCLSSADNPDTNNSAANPVNLTNGNKFQEELDYIGHGEQSGLKVLRYYNSTQLTPSLVGRGWRSSYDSRLYWQGDRPQILLDDSTRIMFLQREGDIVPSRANEVGYLQKTTLLGALEHFDWKATGLKRQSIKDFFSAAYLSSLSDELWIWHQPSGALDLYNQYGNLIISQMPYGDIVFIERELSAGPTHEAVRLVQNQHQEFLEFNYTHEKDGAYLSHIKTPEGDLNFSYEWADEPKAPRLVEVTRPDGSHIRYHYEDTATSPFLVTRAQHYEVDSKEPIKDIAWRYDSKQRAIETHFHHHEELSSPLTMHFNYIKVPEYNGDVGLTEVRQTLGAHTTTSRFHTIMAGAQYHITKSEGFHCFYCPSPGLEARYNDAGQVIGFNNLSIRRRSEDSRIDSIGVAHAGWPGLRIFYDESGKPYAWSSHYTGKTFYEIDSETLEPKYINYANKNGKFWVTSGRPKARNIQTEEYRHVLGTPKAPVPRNLLTARSPGVFYSVGLEGNTMSVSIPVGTNNMSLRTVRNWSHWRQSTLDEVFINYRQQRTVEHQLPESGSLYYEYDENKNLIRIHWSPAGNDSMTQRTLVYERLDQQSRRFGNQLLLKAGPNHRYFKNSTRLELIKEEQSTPYWQELRYYQSNGILKAEHNLSSSLGINKYRQYDFNHLGQLTRVDTETLSVDSTENTSTDLYAWQLGGIGAARQRKTNQEESLIIDTTKRDEAGIPQSMHDLELHYNVRHLLTSISKDGTTIANYVYDSLAHRIKKADAKGETQYYYLNDRLIAEAYLTHDELKNDELKGDFYNKHISRRYIYDGILPVALIDYSQNNTGQLYFIHSDGTGQPFLVTDENQKPVWLADNDSFGQSHILINKIDFNLRLPGQYYDAESGLHHNHYRYYDPVLGHYLEPDPLGPLSSNEIYGYANQNPRQFVDPLGLLLFAFDGTTNTPLDQTNVYKLGQLYNDGPVHYIEGPGTPEALEKSKKFLAERGDYSLGSLPYSDRNEWKIYNQLPPDNLDFDVYVAHSAPYLLNRQWALLIDEMSKRAQKGLSKDNTLNIDLVGFSRGAALASIFANRIAKYTDNNLFEYTARWRTRGKQKIKACVNLRFVGLFDTVHQLGALGSSNVFFNYALSPAWSLYAHAVALNEHRFIMPLTSFKFGNEEKYDNLLEQGFLGNHSDVGGTRFKEDPTLTMNPKQGVYGDLGKIPLNWMYNRAKDIGVPLKELNSIPQLALDTIKNPLIHYPDDDHYKSLQNNFEIDRYYLSDNRWSFPVRFTRQQSDLKHVGRAVRYEHALYKEDIPGFEPEKIKEKYLLRSVRAAEYIDFINNLETENENTTLINLKVEQ